MITIVNYDWGRGGILSKYAEKMGETLKWLGEEVEVTPVPNPKSAINHHINYWPYRYKNSPTSINTLMVTHIDQAENERILLEGLRTAHGVCFSKELSDRFHGTTVIHPAHDGIKKKKTVYVPTKVYVDGRKREWMFYDLLKTVSPQFYFIVMGDGWEFSKFNDHVQYLPKFSYNDHVNCLNQAQYALYLGNDEGSMGMLDATQCGLTTIAPLAGFHKEMGIDHPFETQSELTAIFEKLAENPVESWTWERYVNEHLKLWENLVK